MKNRIEMSLEEEQRRLFELLEYIIEVCQKEGIQLFLGYGSLLGAVRHQGFVPWDDDIDVLMTRENYEKFNDVIHKYAREEYFFQNYKTDKKYPVPEISRICINHTYKWPEGYENAPFHTGLYIDIFPLDFGEKRKEDTLKKMKLCAKCHEFLYRKYRKFPKGQSFITNLKILVQKAIPHSVLSRLLLRTITRHKNGVDKSLLCNYGAAFMGGNKLIYESNWFSDAVYMDFNGIQAPCPVGYKEFLSKFYGNDYMTPKRTKEKRHAAYSIVS